METCDRCGGEIPTKDNVYRWEPVETYAYDCDDEDRERGVLSTIAEVSVQIGEDRGVWFIRTHDEAGGSDDCDNTPYPDEGAARVAALAFRDDRDDFGGRSVEEIVDARADEQAELDAEVAATEAEARAILDAEAEDELDEIVAEFLT